MRCFTANHRIHKSRSSHGPGDVRGRLSVCVEQGSRPVGSPAQVMPVSQCHTEERFKIVFENVGVKTVNY